jgi:hypothetical protein
MLRKTSGRETPADDRAQPFSADPFMGAASSLIHFSRFRPSQMIAAYNIYVVGNHYENASGFLNLRCAEWGAI